MNRMNDIKPPEHVYVAVAPDGLTLHVARSLDELPAWAVNQWVGTYKVIDLQFLVEQRSLI